MVNSKYLMALRLAEEEAKLLRRRWKGWGGAGGGSGATAGGADEGRPWNKTKKGNYQGIIGEGDGSPKKAMGGGRAVVGPVGQEEEEGADG
jgi:hypothetical protein